MPLSTAKSEKQRAVAPSNYRLAFCGNSRAYVRLALGAVWIVSLVVASGCREDPTIWSAQSQNPDNGWIAYAHTVQHSGPGADGVETLVELKRQTSPQNSIWILGFSDDGPSMGLQMTWLSPSHLEVSFKDDQSVLYFQVARTSGVEISVRDIEAASEPSQ